MKLERKTTNYDKFDIISQQQYTTKNPKRNNNIRLPADITLTKLMRSCFQYNL